MGAASGSARPDDRQAVPAGAVHLHSALFAAWRCARGRVEGARGCWWPSDSPKVRHLTCVQRRSLNARACRTRRGLPRACRAGAVCLRTAVPVAREAERARTRFGQQQTRAGKAKTVRPFGSNTASVARLVAPERVCSSGLGLYARLPA